MKKTITIFLSLSTCFSFAQNDKPKRAAFHLEIAANETQQYAFDVPESPYFVKEKVLQVYCGENVLVECETKGDSITSMKVVQKNLKPEKTIVIEFGQNEKRDDIRTELRIRNPFDRTLLYEAGMFTPISEKWKTTSVLPIHAKLQNYELWPHAIVTLVLDGWKLK